MLTRPKLIEPFQIARMGKHRLRFGHLVHPRTRLAATAGWQVSGTLRTRRGAGDGEGEQVWLCRVSDRPRALNLTECRPNLYAGKTGDGGPAPASLRCGRSSSLSSN